MKKFSLIGFFAFTLLFSFFWIAKVLGQLDFSSKYGIAYFESNIYPQDLPLILDGEDTTAWGCGPGQVNNKGDYLIIHFRETLPVNKVRMIPHKNMLPNSFSFSVKDNHNVWFTPLHLSYSNGTFSFDETMASAIKIEVSNNATIYNWKISEILIND